ncbi:MAG: hypothetical protein SV062_00280 [Thermodesulfobacteriota bacterium]|nr:hypothetical protein [Thermodesulfobacteriota bacterium]
MDKAKKKGYRMLCGILLTTKKYENIDKRGWSFKYLENKHNKLWTTRNGHYRF